MTVHGAQYSETIVTEISGILAETYPEVWGRPMLWDPFAGTGVKLARIAQSVEFGFGYGGTEIAASFIDDDHIIHGSATNRSLYPPAPFVIVTSPVYANGMADSWKMSDGSKRHTYRSWIAQNEGEDRQLHIENMGRYGYRGTSRDGKSSKRSTYWDVARRTVQCWSLAELVILNVSDFISKGEVEPHSADWLKLMSDFGWRVREMRRVETPRNGEGANRDVRVPYEDIYVFERPS